MSQRTRFIFLVSCILLLIYSQLTRVDLPGGESTVRIQEAVMNLSLPAPYRERVLPYVLATWGAHAFPNLVIGVLVMHMLINAIALTGFILATDRFFQHWMGRDLALLLIIFTVVTFNVSFQYLPYSLPDSWIEAALFVFAYNLLYRMFSMRREVILPGFMLVLILAIGAANRIQIVALVPLFALLAWKFNRQALRWLPAYILAPLVVYFSIQTVTGHGDSNVWTIERIAQFNLSGLAEALLSVSVFIGGGVIIAIQNWKRAPSLLKWMMVGLLPYIVLIVVFAEWRETRLLVPLLPVLLALTLARKPTTA